MKSHSLHRKHLLKSLLLLPFAGHLPSESATSLTGKKPQRRFKLSLNAYSFNQALSNRSMNLDDLLEYCAITGFDAVDLTGYYFPGYPQVPADDYLFHISFFIASKLDSSVAVANRSLNELNKMKHDM